MPFVITWNESRGCYAKWDVRQRRAKIAWSHLYVESEKQNKQKTKEKHLNKENKKINDLLPKEKKLDRAK